MHTVPSPTINIISCVRTARDFDGLPSARSDVTTSLGSSWSFFATLFANAISLRFVRCNGKGWFRKGRAGKRRGLKIPSIFICRKGTQFRCSRSRPNVSVHSTVSRIQETLVELLAVKDRASWWDYPVARAQKIPKVRSSETPRTGVGLCSKARIDTQTSHPTAERIV